MDDVLIEKLLTPKEVAEYFDVCMGTMYKMIRSGEIEAIRIGKRKWAIPRYLLYKKIDECFNTPVPAIYSTINDEPIWLM